MSGGEEAVQATNDDATLCKVSAVSLGYWADNYIQHMIRSGDAEGVVGVISVTIADLMGGRGELRRYTSATTPEWRGWPPS